MTTSKASEVLREVIGREQISDKMIKESINTTVHCLFVLLPFIAIFGVSFYDALV